MTAAGVTWFHMVAAGARNVGSGGIKDAVPCCPGESAARVAAEIDRRCPGRQNAAMNLKPLIPRPDRFMEASAESEVAIDATRIVTRLAIIAFASIGDFIAIGPDGRLGADRVVVDPDRWAALEVFDVDDRPLQAKAGGGRIRRLHIRLTNKLAALDALSRHLGLFAACSGTPVDQAFEPARFSGTSPSAARRERFVAEVMRRGEFLATRRSNASRPRGNPEIRDAIAVARHRLARRLAVSAERVLEEYTRIAFASTADYLDISDDGPARLDLRRVRPEHWAGLRELVVEQHIDRPGGLAPDVRSWRLKLASKQHALDALMRHRGLFGADVQLRLPG